MSDFKSKLPDLKEVTAIAGKLFKDLKTSVSEIMSDYKEKDGVVNINDIDYKWTDIWDALYYRFVSKNKDMLKKIYAAARNVAQWEKKSHDEQTKLINLSNIYLNWLNKN